ncbi:hypothetical protein Ga0466249_005036 [Sporomusaceae bacterium BoRhaA]|nr:hypothetical protein [Pelorhabdus rhamnosifermentans]
MAQDFSKKLYNSAAWKKCRTAYIKSVFCLCETCKKPTGTSGILHHKITLTEENINDPNITLNWDHLEYLCHSCHNQIHADALPVREDVRFDEHGNLVKR